MIVEERPADIRIHYCKSQKASGKPIMLTELGHEELKRRCR